MNYELEYVKETGDKKPLIRFNDFYDYEQWCYRFIAWLFTQLEKAENERDRGATMTKRRCKLFGHKWVPLFTRGRFKNIEVKFIGCYCKRCHYGYQDMLLTINKMTKMEYNMHKEL